MPKKATVPQAAKKAAAVKKAGVTSAKPAVKTPVTKKGAVKKIAPKKAATAKVGPKKVAVKKAAANKVVPKKVVGKKAGVAEPAVKAKVLASKTVFSGKVFRVDRETIVEPGGGTNTRDIVRHNSSAVILALDSSQSKRDPWVVIERQYRHAANRFLWELPAGKLEAGEDPVTGAQRELEEETGYRAKSWTPLTEYYASPGFLSETMKVFLAEGLIPGNAHPEADEQIEIRLVKFSELLQMVEIGGIIDGKTIISVLLYARQLKAARGKKVK